MSTYTVAITGASGVVYGIRLLEYLLKEGHKVFLVITKEGFEILRGELDINWDGGEKGVNRGIERYFKSQPGQVTYFDEDNLSAPISSGSFRIDGMIIIPCSMKTLASIANGFADNLIERGADVVLKERRPLILVPRETPLNVIHLNNMLTSAKAGAHIIPAMPAFYHHPKTVEDMVNFIVGRVLDAIGIKNELYRRWE